MKPTSEKVSYGLGADIGASLKRWKDDIDLSMFIRGVKDTLEGKEPLLTRQQAGELIRSFMAEKQGELEKDVLRQQLARRYEPSQP